MAIGPEAPALTDAERIIQQNDALLAQNEQLIAGYNAIGANVQWIVDNVQGIFQMFANPAFMSNMMNQMTGVLSGNGPQAGTGEDPGDDGTADG